MLLKSQDWAEVKETTIPLLVKPGAVIIDYYATTKRETRGVIVLFLHWLTVTNHALLSSERIQTHMLVSFFKNFFIAVVVGSLLFSLATLSKKDSTSVSSTG